METLEIPDIPKDYKSLIKAINDSIDLQKEHMFRPGDYFCENVNGVEYKYTIEGYDNPNVHIHQFIKSKSLAGDDMEYSSLIIRKKRLKDPASILYSHEKSRKEKQWSSIMNQNKVSKK